MAVTEACSAQLGTTGLRVRERIELMIPNFRAAVRALSSGKQLRAVPQARFTGINQREEAQWFAVSLPDLPHRKG